MTTINENSGPASPQGLRRDSSVQSLGLAKPSHHHPILPSVDFSDARHSKAWSTAAIGHHDIRPSSSSSSLLSGQQQQQQQQRSGAPLSPILPTARQSRASMTTRAKSGSKDVRIGGLGLHVEQEQEENSTLPLFIKKRTSAASPVLPSPSPKVQASNPTHTMAATAVSQPSFPDFAVPDFSDPMPSFDHHLLLSPFTLDTLNFGASPSGSLLPAATLSSSPGGAATATSNASLSPRQLASAPGSSERTSRLPSPTSTAPQVTPSSPPRRRFFQTDSASSFARFPTPDKLSLGHTPSPAPALSSDLLSPPAGAASSSAPAADSEAPTGTGLPKSSSAHTFLSESSFTSADSSPSSSSHLSDILAGAPAPPAETPAAAPSHAAPSSNMGQATRSRANSRHEDIRASLLQFPTPPCSPRMFEGFASALGQAQASADALRPALPLPMLAGSGVVTTGNGYGAPSLASSKCSSAATPALTHCDTSSESHNHSLSLSVGDAYDQEDAARVSFDSVQLPYVPTPEKAPRNSVMLLSDIAKLPHPYAQAGRHGSQLSNNFAPFFLPPLQLPVRAPSLAAAAASSTEAGQQKSSKKQGLSVPPTAELPPVPKPPAPANATPGRASLPPKAPLPQLPHSLPTSPTLSSRISELPSPPAQLPVLISSSPSASSSSAGLSSNVGPLALDATLESLHKALGSFGAATKDIPSKQSQSESAQPDLIPIKLTVTASVEPEAPAAGPSRQIAQPTAADQAQGTDKAPSRRRRASLSIKIPKILSKLRKADAQASPALPVTPFDVPASRFSPDSEAPSSAALKPGFVKRLTRAVSSPNLRASPSMPNLPSAKKESHFVAPTSAPPVPVSFPLLPPTTTATAAGDDSPLPTPGLTSDIASSAASTPPIMKQPGGAGSWLGPSSYSLQNPYFPIVPSPLNSPCEPSQNSPALSAGAFGSIAPAASEGAAGARSNSPTSHDDMQWLDSLPTSRMHDASSPTREAGRSPAAGSSTPSSTQGVRYAPLPSRKAARSGSSASGSGSLGTGSSSGSQDDEDDEEGDDRSRKSMSDDSDDYGASDEEEQENSDGDDNVPLATAHPTALQAQKSLKDKLKERRKSKQLSTSATPTKKSVAAAPSRTASDSRATVGRSFSSSGVQTTAPLPKRPSPRKQQTAPLPVQRNPFDFSPDELSRKLSKVDAAKLRGRSATLRKEDNKAKRPESMGDRPHNLLLPQTDEQVKRRNRSRGKHGLAPPLAPFVQDSVLTMSEGSSDDDDVPLKARVSQRTQTRGATSKPEAPKAAQPPRQALLERKATQSSTTSPPTLASQAPLASPAPATIAPSDLASSQKPVYHSKQRIYVNDPQHHFMYDIDDKTTPAMLLAHLRGQGTISSNPAWAVVEMWRNLGVERPMREYELLHDSIQSWSNESNASLFLVKKTAMASRLVSSAASVDSESVGGWVQMETKRGKWSKRWLEIRNQSIFVGKSEKPRDQTMLCTLSSFDSYHVPQACVAKLKAPKPFAFALKSVDKVTLFENAQDYIHYFSVKTEPERDQWIQRVLDARSILVQQTLAARASASSVDTRTNIISQPVAAPQVSRSNSRHQSPPLPQSAMFAEGSLMARQSSTASNPSSSPPHSSTSQSMPPVPTGNPTFAHIPQGREWEKLSSEEKQRRILEAGKKARTEGKPLIDLEGQLSAQQQQQLARSGTKSAPSRK